MQGQAAWGKWMNDTGRMFTNEDSVDVFQHDKTFAMTLKNPNADTCSNRPRIMGNKHCSGKVKIRRIEPGG